MKISCKLDYTYMSGWKGYTLDFTTEFSDSRNAKIFSGSIVAKDACSSKYIISWAAEKGFDLPELFTDYDNAKKDSQTFSKFTGLLADWNDANLKEMSTNKCFIDYSATKNPKFKPMETAFETFFMYDVLVKIEFNNTHGQLIIPVPAREKDDNMPFIMMSGKNMGKTLYEEEEAINYVSSKVDKLVDECDSEEKFNALARKLNEIQKTAFNSLKR